MDQRDLSASLLSARSFSAFSDEGDHVHDDGGRGERRQRLLLRILGLSFEEPRAFWRWYRAVYGLLVLAATVGYGICYAGVLALADGGAAEGRKRERNSQLQRLRSRLFSTRFG